MAETTGVRDFHLNDDLDSSKQAHHHTIGLKYGQAAPGEGFAKLKKDFDAHIANDFSRIGKTVLYGGTTTSSIPNAPANPYTSISGFTNEWGDQPTGLQYQGLGVFNCTKTGRYLVEVNFGLASNGAGRRIIFWFKNGTVDEYRRMDDSPSNGVTVTCHAITVMRLVAGDTVELRFFQDSGAALNMQQSGNLIDNGSDWSRMVIISTLG